MLFRVAPKPFESQNTTHHIDFRWCYSSSPAIRESADPLHMPSWNPHSPSELALSSLHADKRSRSCTLPLARGCPPSGDSRTRTARPLGVTPPGNPERSGLCELPLARWKLVTLPFTRLPWLIRHTVCLEVSISRRKCQLRDHDRTRTGDLFRDREAL